MYRNHAKDGIDRPPLFTTSDGVTFRRMPHGADAVYVVGEYRFDDIRPDDIALDLGANVGAFSIRAARRSGHVLAIEPILTEALRENVARNGGGVDVVDGALGTGESVRIAWGKKTLTVTTRTLGEFAAMAGGCDFVNYPALKGVASCFMDNTCITAM